MIHHPVYFYGETTSMDLRKNITINSMPRLQRLQLLKVTSPEHNRPFKSSSDCCFSCTFATCKYYNKG
ncbi:unnamed protein product [Caenorhabditis brenneri]